jgi:hypothetical protein
MAAEQAERQEGRYVRKAARLRKLRICLRLSYGRAHQSQDLPATVAVPQPRAHQSRST